MNTNVNKKKRLLIGASLVLGVLIAADALVPRLFDSATLRAKAEDLVSRELGGTVLIEKINGGLFPRPHISFHRTTLSIPGLTTGTIASLDVFPRILPLLRGKVELSSIRLKKPDFSILLPEPRPDHDTPSSELGLASLQKTLQDVSTKLPGLTITVKNGRITFNKEGRTLILEDLAAKADAATEDVALFLECRTVFSEKISFTAKIAPRDFVGRGEVLVKRFMPHLIPKGFLPPAIDMVGETEGDLHLSFTSKGITEVQAGLEGSFPLLTVVRGSGSSRLKISSLKANYDLNRDTATMTITNMTFQNPALSLTGKLVKSSGSGQVTLELTGEKIDIKGVREKALAIAGNVPVVRTIFGYLHGGTIPRVTFRTDSNSFSGLGKTEDIRVKGSISGGSLHIPGPEFLLNGVSGDIIIENGILKGTSIVSNFENNRGTNGTVRVGLKGKSAPILVETAVHSDADAVLRLLLRIAKSDDLKKELSLIHDLTGTAEGRVIIGERIDAMDVRVEVPKMNISAGHERFLSKFMIGPLSLTVKGKSIALANSDFSIGKSRFKASGDMRFDEEILNLNMNVMSDRIILDDLTTKRVGSAGMASSAKDRQGSQIRGEVRLKAEALDLKEFRISPFQADISLKPKTATITVKNSAFCSIRTSGSITRSQDTNTLDLRFEAKDRELRPTVLCLTNSRTDATGTFSLKANLKAKGRAKELGNAIQGGIDFSSLNGSVFRSKPLDNVFDFLNKGEEVQGALPDLDKKEFSYNLLKAKATYKSGLLTISEGILNSAILHAIAQGTIHTEEGTLDLDVMVAPLKTVSKISQNIPIIGTITGGSLVSVPVKVRGTFADPQVTYLSPSAAVSNLSEMMKRTIGLPFRIMSPFFREEKQP